MGKIYYLDTNICIFHIRKPFGVIAKRINALDPDHIKIPAIVKAELLVGAEKSKRRDEALAETLSFCEAFEIVPFDDTMTEIYGKIKASLEVKGMKIGFNDNIIAATVLARKGILVTNNTREFNRVDGLLIEDWAQE
ncbi:MAG: type II toxin-antitoxin system VapC family toxin [Synergistaceae bacterium]|nr:type II toxin-antitoxin system VapC family toxin [Synergistaceae bacterium]